MKEEQKTSVKAVDQINAREEVDLPPVKDISNKSPSLSTEISDEKKANPMPNNTSTTLEESEICKH